MGADDDLECEEHDFLLESLIPMQLDGEHGKVPGLGMWVRCERCGALEYEPSRAEEEAERQRRRDAVGKET